MKISVNSVISVVEESLAHPFSHSLFPKTLDSIFPRVINSPRFKKAYSMKGGARLMIMNKFYTLIAPIGNTDVDSRSAPARS